jgi:hypothetical protein
MDVLVERAMRAAPAAVAAIMFDPGHDARWIGGVRAVERLTPGPLALGSRVRRHGGFLGRKFSWVTEVTALEPERALAMSFLEGPLRGGVAYAIRPNEGGAVVAIRNQGRARFTLPGMAWFVGRGVAKDLARLATLVEGGG